MRKKNKNQKLIRTEAGRKINESSLCCGTDEWLFYCVTVLWKW